MAIVRKITAKIVVGKLDKKEIINSDPENPLWKMAIYGQAHRAIPGESDYGPYLKFRGTFEGVNLESGETFNSMNLIVPPIAEEIIEEGLNLAAEAGNVEFALKIGVRRDDDAATGYVWVAESMQESQKDDPLARLRGDLTKQKLIPLFPDAETEAEPEPEPEAKPARPARGGRTTKAGK